jgi:hypothetical protein
MRSFLKNENSYLSRTEIREVLSKYISIPSDELLREIKEEEEL